MIGQKHVEKNTCAKRDRLFSFYHVWTPNLDGCHPMSNVSKQLQLLELVCETYQIIPAGVWVKIARSSAFRTFGPQIWQFFNTCRVDEGPGCLVAVQNKLKALAFTAFCEHWAKTKTHGPWQAWHLFSMNHPFWSPKSILTHTYTMMNHNMHIIHLPQCA